MIVTIAAAVVVARQARPSMQGGRPPPAQARRSAAAFGVPNADQAPRQRVILWPPAAQLRLENSASVRTSPPRIAKFYIW